VEQAGLKYRSVQKATREGKDNERSSISD